MNETLGWNLILMGNLMRPHLNAEQQELIDSIQGDDWYPADELQGLLTGVRETVGEDGVRACGKGIYYTIKDQVEQMGVKTPLDAVRSIIPAYLENNRGESVGEWRLIKDELGHVTIEDRTIYDCALGEGVVLGAIKAFGGWNVEVTHTKCRKRGDEECLNQVTWTEATT